MTIIINAEQAGKKIKGNNLYNIKDIFRITASSMNQKGPKNFYSIR
jgi:hypothetical protein